MRRSSRESRESLREGDGFPAGGRPDPAGLPEEGRPEEGRPPPAGLPELERDGAPGRPPLDGRPEDGLRSDPPRELPAAGIAIPFDVPHSRGIVATNNKGHPKVAFVEKLSGGVLLSHTVTRAVPSALRGLASGFGM